MGDAASLWEFLFGPARKQGAIIAQIGRYWAPLGTVAKLYAIVIKAFFGRGAAGGQVGKGRFSGAIDDGCHGMIRIFSMACEAHDVFSERHPGKS